MPNWKQSLIDSGASIREVIETIDRNSLQIALVVEDNKLIGTVTDGDIRRGLLRGINLNHNVQEIMNRTPITGKAGESRGSIINLMKFKQIRHIPLVDTENNIIDLVIMDDIINPPQKDNWVVLMVGGLGSRLRPLTDECPKPLLKVGGKPLLETILETYISYGFHKFYFSVNYKAEMVQNYFGNGSKWNVEIKYIYETKKLGTAGALGLIPEKPLHPLLVMNGDLLTKVNFSSLLDFHLENNSAATMCIREYDIQIPYGVVNVEKNKLLSIQEKPIHRFFVNAGIYVINPEVLDYIDKNQYLDMPSLFEKLMENQSDRTSAFPIREYWLDIGRISDYEKANVEYMEVFGD